LESRKRGSPFFGGAALSAGARSSVRTASSASSIMVSNAFT
jgi:hypothetical protein